MSDFYKTIQKHYDSIFPLNTSQVDFTIRNFEKSSKLLEVGCATGKLTNALSDFQITGIDIDEEFITTARNRYPNLNFHARNMLDIDSLQTRFNGIICYGNTLVHINHNDIRKFISTACIMLEDRGRLIIQIVNYDNILKNNISELPLLDREDIKFERYYYHGNPFIFKGILTDKATGKVSRTEVELFPMTSSELYSIMSDSGFINIKLSGDFEENDYNIDSKAIVISGTKN